MTIICINIKFNIKKKSYYTEIFYSFEMFREIFHNFKYHEIFKHLKVILSEC